MALHTSLKTVATRLARYQRTRIERHLHALERRLIHHPAPTADLVITMACQGRARQHYDVDFRVQVGPLGRHLVSHRRARTPDRAARRAIEDVERQLERLHAAQRDVFTEVSTEASTAVSTESNWVTPGAPGTTALETVTK